MLKKVKVVHISTGHRALDVRIFRKQCKTLNESGYEVIFIVPNHQSEVVDGVRIVALPKSQNRIYRMTYLTLEALRAAQRQKADVYHLHDLALVPLGLLLKIFMQKKVIYDIHEDYPKSMLDRDYLPGFMLPFLAKGVDWLQKISARILDHIIVAGDDILETFSESGLSQQVTVVKNVPLREFAFVFDPGKQIKENQLIYVGRVNRIRGVKEIVEAMHYVHHQAELLVIGPCNQPGYEEEIRRVVNAKVRILGSIPYREVLTYLKTAKIGLICFQDAHNHMGALSGRNTKLYEYMCGGLAIIGANFQSWRKIIEGGPYGITVDPCDPKDIAAAIDRLLDDPELLKQMGQNGLKAVREQYNWDIEKEKLLGVYRRVLKG